MVFFFIHGVNTRDTLEHREEMGCVRGLFGRHVAASRVGAPGAAYGLRFVPCEWGDLGAQSYWENASFPEIDFVEDLGGSRAAARESSIEWLAAVHNLGIAEAGQEERQFTAEGANNTVVLFARAHPHLFLKSLLAPFTYMETSVPGTELESGEDAGRALALLLSAGQYVIDAPELSTALSDVSTLDELQEAVQASLRTSLEAMMHEYTQAPEPSAGDFGTVESLGSTGDLAKRVTFFGLRKLAHDLRRPVTLVAIERLRRKQARSITNFVGDVLTYINERGTVEAPGPVVDRVLTVLRSSREQGEPTIVLTHSFGGIILYDILTYYGRDIEVDVWISCGGQVGFFEELKLFKASNKSIAAPERVDALEHRVHHWLNIYDPVDPFAFKAEPVFALARDEKFNTHRSSLVSHSYYLRDPHFYQVIAAYLDTVLR